MVTSIPGRMVTHQTAEFQVGDSNGHCCHIRRNGLIGQNNDSTRGWTSNIMPWGMLRE